MSVVLYLATEQGVMTARRTAGDSWDLAAQALKGWAVQDVTAAPNDPSTVLAATRGDGVWLSRDAGVSWAKPSYGRPGPGKVRCLAFDPHNPQRIYAGCEPIELFVSDDLGAHWQRIDSVRDVPSVAAIEYPVPGVEPHIRDITIDPTDPRVLYLALQVGYMIKSIDGGQSWKVLDRAIDSDVHTIVVDPADRRNVLIATGGHDSRQGRSPGRALYRSADGGESWKPSAMEFSQEYAVPLVMHPRNSNVLFSSVANGTPGAWGRPSGPEAAIIRTLDGGESWQRLGGASSEISGFFASSIAFDDDEPDHVYVSLNSGDLLASQDGGDSWVKLNLRTSRVLEMKCVRA
jgi:photosystem II stability/assembly factor-like uncharacterized protein